jgi:predicted nuclease of restriction endonuclease-like (RecB) superfamily
MNKPANTYHQLIESIDQLLKQGRQQAAIAVNCHIVHTYWEIGRYIVEYEQKGEIKSKYGSKLLDYLSKDLTLKVGKGLSRSNLIYIRKLFLVYEKVQTVSGQLTLIQRDVIGETVSHQLKQISETVFHQLSWSHYFELLKINDKLERSFYEKQCIIEKWSVRELKRQINSALFQRLALSKDKEGILELAKKGQVVNSVNDLIKDPYIFEFLNLPEKGLYSESDLEKALLDKLQNFLMELGKGFTFVGRQYRITISNKHHRVDLVFYHRLLKCFVLIDLKLGEVNHQDVGQMNLYLNYFEKEENIEGENQPVGIILSALKDDILVEYALGNISSQMFISTYQLYLPDKKLLKEKLQILLDK